MVAILAILNTSGFDDNFIPSLLLISHSGWTVGVFHFLGKSRMRQHKNLITISNIRKWIRNNYSAEVNEILYPQSDEFNYSPMTELFSMSSIPLVLCTGMLSIHATILVKNDLLPCINPCIIIVIYVAIAIYLFIHYFYKLKNNIRAFKNEG